MTIHLAAFADLPAQVHTIVMLGSRTSDHLQELVRMAEFKGRLAYRIETAAQLQPRWFIGQKHVGLVLGASELKAELKVVVERLQQFAAEDNHGSSTGNAI